MAGFQHKFETEQEARAYAVQHYGQTEVQIIQSQGMFYLEDADSGTLLRTWEREAFSGLGRRAQTYVCFNCHEKATYGKPHACEVSR